MKTISNLVLLSNINKISFEEYPIIDEATKVETKGQREVSKVIGSNLPEVTRNEVTLQLALGEVGRKEDKGCKYVALPFDACYDKDGGLVIERTNEMIKFLGLDLVFDKATTALNTQLIDFNKKALIKLQTEHSKTWGGMTDEAKSELLISAVAKMITVWSIREENKAKKALTMQESMKSLGVEYQLTTTTPERKAEIMTMLTQFAMDIAMGK